MFLFWGNSADDTTNIYERLDASLTGITTETAKKVAKKINDRIDFFTNNYTVPAAKKVAGGIKAFFDFV